MFDPTMLALMKKMGGSSSWNDLTDKPFGETTEVVEAPLLIEWDGNTEGLVSVPVGENVGFCKVSDIVLADEQIVGCTIVLSNGQSDVMDDATWGSIVSAGYSNERFALFSDLGIVIRTAGLLAELGVTFPETGVYFGRSGDMYQTSLSNPNVMVETETVTVKPLPVEYLPDGVPYVAEGLVEILPECQPTYVDDDVGFFISSTPAIVVGETYTVVWNGTEYQCVAQDLSALVAGAVGLGNLAEMGFTPTGEPFVVAVSPGEGTTFGPYDGSTEFTVSIYGKGTEIRKLDTRLLPDGVPWMKTEFTDLLPLTTLTDVSTQSVNELPVDLALVVGNIYTVTWNGAKYSCVAKPHSLEGMSFVVIGNVDGSGEPFLIASSAGMPSWLFPQDGSTSVTLAVSGEVETLNKLDPKLYALDLPGAFDVIGTGVTLHVGDSAASYMMDVVAEQMKKGIVRIAFQYADPFESGTVYDKTLTLFASDEENAVGTFVHGDLILMVHAAIGKNSVELNLVPMFTGNPSSPQIFNEPVAVSPSGKLFAITVDDSGVLTTAEITA